MDNITRLIAPPIEEEIYPYRRVWRSVIGEATFLVLLAVILFIISRFVSIELPGNLQQVAALFIALLPAILWFWFSYRPEKNMPQPRSQLILVFILSILAANTIGLPFVVDILQPQLWLAQESTVNRIIGFTVTAGVIQEIVKYVIVRYIAWGEHYRIRYDSIAYCAASAVGYSIVINLHFVLNTPASLDVIAGHVLFNYAVQLSGSLIISYGLASSSLSDATSIILLPMLFISGAFVAGSALAVRNDINNATLVLSAISRPFLSLAFTVGYIYVFIIIIAFLYRIAEERDEY